MAPKSGKYDDNQRKSFVNRFKIPPNPWLPRANKEDLKVVKMRVDGLSVV